MPCATPLHSGTSPHSHPTLEYQPRAPTARLARTIGREATTTPGRGSRLTQTDGARMDSFLTRNEIAMRNIRMFVAESQLSEGGVGIDRSLDKRRPPEQPSTGRNTPA